MLRENQFLQENRRPEGTSGGFRGYFWATWEQTGLSECKVDVKIGKVESQKGQEEAQRSQEAGQKGELARQKWRQLEANMPSQGVKKWSSWPSKGFLKAYLGEPAAKTLLR